MDVRSADDFLSACVLGSAAARGVDCSAERLNSSLHGHAETLSAKCLTSSPLCRCGPAKELAFRVGKQKKGKKVFSIGQRNLQPDRVFALVDAMDIRGFGELFAEDGRVTFGNAEPMIGRDGIAAGLKQFYKSIAALRHEVVNIWSNEAHTIAYANVTYRRLDGHQVSVPSATIYHIDDGKIDDYRIFIDLSPVYS
jgi:ketosteroid isomerase-like protein